MQSRFGWSRFPTFAKLAVASTALSACLYFPRSKEAAQAYDGERVPEAGVPREDEPTLPLTTARGVVSASPNAPLSKSGSCYARRSRKDLE